MGRSVYGLVVPEYHALFRALNEAVFQGESKSAEFEVIGLKGTHRWMETHACPLRDTEGKIFAQLGVTRDITQRKQAERRLIDSLERLHRTQRQLIEASHRAGMAEVASSVLHNVGNVLNSVNTSAGTAARTVRDLPVTQLAKLSGLFHQHSSSLADFFATDPRGKLVPDYLAQVADELGRQRDHILQEFKLLAQHIEHIKRIVKAQQTYATVRCFAERVPLDELVEIACSLSCAGSERSTANIVCRFGRIGTVHVDKHRVLQIVTNLLTNAKQAADGVPPDQRRIELFAEIDTDDQMVIMVSDNGKGIAPDQLNNIFQYGFTTKADGHGYGLHSSANAAREMRGVLTVHSGGLGRGATFTLRVPQAADRALEEEESLDPAESNGHAAMITAAGSCI
jgi:signal transduction histidine kinase